MNTTIGEDQFPKPGVEEVFQLLAKKGIFSCLVNLNYYRGTLLAPSGALIAIPTCYWSSTPTFSDHTGPQHRTFTF